ncbi:single-stranded-DNA-specific exonuclease RecJ [bacterium]|nr:single-stranded-DNA-specific exonuclease RecJ [bacterium]
MQFEMHFDDGSGPSRATSARRVEKAAPAGLFTRRAWASTAVPTAAVLESVRRALPLPGPASEHLVALIAARGQTSTEQLEQFFYPTLDHLHDPLLLDEMDTAVARLLGAASRREKVAIHGDFDVDGLTGTAILAELFVNLVVDGNRARPTPPFVPDRIGDGYGIARHKLAEWGAQGVDLLVAVDTGSAAHAELGLARDLGMDVVVLDHHLFDQRPAAAVALVNPRREGNRYPNPELCGAAVAFKLVQALVAAVPGCLPPDFPLTVIDLAALGTIADQMSLVGENRVLVLRGLERIRDHSSVRPGVAALLSIAGLDGGFPVSATNIAYQVAPRLNACGRIGRVQTALDLLLTHDVEEARRLAKEADDTNERRKQADMQVKVDAVAQARPYAERGDPGLVLGSADWHRGIIGISAARLVEIFNVPTILFSLEGREARGSARSVPDIDIKAALDRCADLLIRFGGHPQAAGMTLRTSDLDAFREAFLGTLRADPGNGGIPEVYDLMLSLTEMDTDEIARLTCEIALLAPFGEGNRSPVFRCNGLRLARLPYMLGRAGEHLRFTFRGPDRPSGGGTPSLSREFISFGSGQAWAEMVNSEQGRARDLIDRRWDILFRLEPNTWRPRRGTAVDPVQQQLIDITPADAS